MNIVKMAKENKEIRILLIKKLARDTKKSFNTFWAEKYESGKKMVPNPNPKGRAKKVTAYTALKHDSFRKKVQKEYEEWKKGDEKPSDKGPTKYTNLDITGGRGQVEQRIAQSSYHKFFEGKDIISECLDLCGMSSVKDSSLEVSFYVYSNSVNVSVSSSDFHAERSIRFKEGTSEPYVIGNDGFRVNEKGEGTGTRIFSSQVQKARRAGFQRIETYGARSYSYIGYHVWPSLGYDTISETRFRNYVDKEWIKKMEEAKLPISIQSLYSLSGGREYWKEHGESQDLEFSLQGDSQSVQILNAYLERKNMDKIANKKPPEKKLKKMPKGWSDSPKLDEKILKEIWDNRKK